MNHLWKVEQIRCGLGVGFGLVLPMMYEDAAWDEDGGCWYLFSHALAKLVYRLRVAFILSGRQKVEMRTPSRVPEVGYFPFRIERVRVSGVVEADIENLQRSLFSHVK